MEEISRINQRINETSQGALSPGPGAGLPPEPPRPLPAPTGLGGFTFVNPDD